MRTNVAKDQKFYVGRLIYLIFQNLLLCLLYLCVKQRKKEYFRENAAQ